MRRNDVFTIFWLKKANKLSLSRSLLIVGFDPSGYNPRIYFTPLIKHGYRGRRLIINSRNIKILSACIYASSTVTRAQGPEPCVKALSFYLSATIEQTLAHAAKIGITTKGHPRSAGTRHEALGLRARPRSSRRRVLYNYSAKIGVKGKAVSRRSNGLNANKFQEFIRLQFNHNKNI